MSRSTIAPSTIAEQGSASNGSAPKEDVPAEDKKLSKQRLQDFQNDECNTRLTGLSQGVASAPRQTPDLDDILAPLQQLKPS